jgi:S1-C subfamily serine protease
MRERVPMKLFCLIVFVAGVTGVAAAQGAPPNVTLDMSTEIPLRPAPKSTVQSAPPRKSIPAIAKAANGAIVSIVMSNMNGRPIAQGSGFLVSKDGLIVTNYHVISEGSSAVVKLPDGDSYVVDGVLAFDKTRDVAVIKAHGENFRTLMLGNSDQIQVGQEVVAIGNPLSLASNVSNGIVSGIRTDEKRGGKFLQVTAPISPGSSGGPLFNMMGEVVGITTLYLEGGENLNFAIPINDAKRLLVADFSKLKDLPNEAIDKAAEGSSGEAGSICNFLTSRMTAALPQVPTLCDLGTSASGVAKASVFAPVPIFSGSFRRAWSMALFQTLQAAAIEGPCQAGCSISVSDSQQTSVRYETYLSKESMSLKKQLFSQMGGFGSDEAYLAEWSDLLRGTSIMHPIPENNMKYLANRACEDYLRSLREDPTLSYQLRTDSGNFPSLPTCSTLFATGSSVYVVLDFPNLLMPFLGFSSSFGEPMVNAFHDLDRYDGDVILRSPWLTHTDGTKERYYIEYSLHWLGFIYDEVTSGVRTKTDGRILLNRNWARQVGQVYPHDIFNEDAKTGTLVARHAAVYKVIPVATHTQIQLTDGSEWNVFQASACTVSVGDELSVVAIKAADGEDQHISLTKGQCKVNASLVGAW